ncbi:MAG TPA: class I SAM-dependent methyltransferase [Candidatus Binatia bacterium]|nr:class I SAM-dependent methyltransferase [Candidatus Binatia bacterium]
MSAHYDRYLTQHLSHVSRPGAVERNAIFVLEHHGRHFPSDRNAAILEIGPGFGGLIDCLHNRCGYRNVSGVDISREAVEASNRVLTSSTELAENTVEFLEHRPEQFDMVLMLHVLEHVAEQNAIPLLEAVRGALKANGKLVVEVPNAIHPVAGAYNRYFDFTHKMGFTDRSLEFVLRSAGFDEVTIYGCRIPRKNPARLIQRTAQDLMELLAAVRLRLYLPKQPLNLALTLGACAMKRF